jgi:hypothetical protein
MVEWCLAESYQPDGSFKVSELDETAGDAYMYGVAFLKDTIAVQNKPIALAA